MGDVELDVDIVVISKAIILPGNGYAKSLAWEVAKLQVSKLYRSQI
jgi:hypothetical protein